MATSTPLVDPLPVPKQCMSDQYLTEEVLGELFNDFNLGSSASLPRATLFSQLVNGVRQAYLPRLLDQHQPLNSQPAMRVRESSQCGQQDLAEAYLMRHELVVKLCPQPIVTETKCAPMAVKDAMPAYTDILHIGGADKPRRDMVGWVRQDKRGWTARLDFKVFKFLEINTIKISIFEHHGPHRVCALLPVHDPGQNWTSLLHFYAFSEQRPGTEMISVGQANEPYRCIFVRGEHADKLEGWTEKFTFWVPV